MLDSELAFFRSQIGQNHGDALQRGEGLPEGAISAMVRGGPFSGLDEPCLNFIIRELETSFTVTQRRGAVISKGHRPWLAARKPSTDFYYWNRLRKYYLETGILPSKVLATLDADTDQVLDFCGDPLDANYGFVRGMVMGNVQSGKTTNYSALICKAGGRRLQGDHSSGRHNQFAEDADAGADRRNVHRQGLSVHGGSSEVAAHSELRCNAANSFIRHIARCRLFGRS